MTRIANWIPILALAFVMLLLQLIGPELLRYETRSIGELQLWRLLSGHWVHANWIHYAMNMAGFGLCLALTGVAWSLWQWGWRILVLSAGISLAFYIWRADIGWYVGFSGVLFGLYVLTAFSSLARQALMSSLLLGFIALKIGLEQGSSVTITSADLIGVPVLVDAHLYGVLAAVAIILLRWLFAIIFQTTTNTTDSQ